MTVHQTAKLIEEYYYNRLTNYEKRFIKDILSGLGGLGEIDDFSVSEYLTDKQVRLVRKIGMKFLITKASKIT